MNLILPYITGAVFGLSFAILKLPLPSPPTFGGLLGIIGVWSGYHFYINYFGGKI